MADLVIDISIVADWDPRVGESPAEVFIYTKIIPQPAAKVSLLHLQSLVAKTTLLRVIPLLPDGSSPRESPGIRALGIPVVAGRNRTTSKTLVAQRRVSESTLDGVDSTCSSESVESTFGSDEEGENSMDTLQAAEEQATDGAHGVLKPNKNGLASLTAVDGGGSFTPECSPGNRKGVSRRSEDLRDSTAPETFSDGGDIFCTPLRRFRPSDFKQRSRRFNDEPLVSDVGISYSRDADGSFKPAETAGWREICRLYENAPSPIESRNCERKNRVCSISSVARDLSPMSEKTLERIVELSIPVTDMSGGQDGTTEESEAVLHSAEVTARYAAAAKEYSSAGLGNVIPIEGEVGKLETGSEGVEPKTEEIGWDETKMVVEQDTLFICFPNKIRSDAVVIEMVLEINPLYLEGKSYVTFILAGLPYCSNGAYIKFRIDDEDDWKFNTYPEVTNTESPEENSLCGVLDLTEKSHTISTNRSIIIRALRCPMVLEVFDFKLTTGITADFLWSPTNERITSEFEMNLVFLNLESNGDAKRSAIDLFLINGPERQEDLTVDSPQGIPTDFALGDREFENYEIGACRCRVLRVERPTEDAHRPLRIRFNKQLGSIAQEIGIPIIRVGGEATLVEESIAIMKTKLPVEVVFSPNSKSWKEMDKSGVGAPKKFTRTGISMREANPSVFISCLHQAISPIAEEMGRVLVGNCGGLIDRITYDIEESESFDHRGAPMVAVKMSFSIDVPVGMEQMEEIVRVHTGSFGFKFATINEGLPGKGVLFEDGDELLLLNCEIFKGGRDGNGKKERLLISTEWFGEKRLELSCGGMLEFRLPRVIAKVVRRTIFECTNQQACIISRTQDINGKNATFGFIRGKAIISGIDTNKSEVFLQIPCKNESSGHDSLDVAGSIVTPSTPSQSGTPSFGSIFGEGFEVIQKQYREQPETTTQDGDRISPNVSTSHWVWEMKETLFLVLIITFLCFNLISQSARNSALKVSLRQTTALLEEREKILNRKIINGRASLDDPPPHPTPQKHQALERGLEDMWWSVVGLGDTQEIGHVKIGVLRMNSPDTGLQACGATKIADDEMGGQNTNEEQHAQEVLDGPNDYTQQDGELEHQKKVVQLLLEEESFAEKTQRIVVNVFMFFWSLVFGV